MFSGTVCTKMKANTPVQKVYPTVKTVSNTVHVSSSSQEDDTQKPSMHEMVECSPTDLSMPSKEKAFQIQIKTDICSPTVQVGSSPTGQSKGTFQHLSHVPHVPDLISVESTNNKCSSDNSQIAAPVQSGGAVNGRGSESELQNMDIHQNKYSQSLWPSNSNNSMDNSRQKVPCSGNNRTENMSACMNTSYSGMPANLQSPQKQYESGYSRGYSNWKATEKAMRNMAFGMHLRQNSDSAIANQPSEHYNLYMQNHNRRASDPGGSKVESPKFCSSNHQQIGNGAPIQFGQLNPSPQQLTTVMVAGEPELWIGEKEQSVQISKQCNEEETTTLSKNVCGNENQHQYSNANLQDNYWGNLERELEIRKQQYMKLERMVASKAQEQQKLLQMRKTMAADMLKINEIRRTLIENRHSCQLPSPNTVKSNQFLIGSTTTPLQPAQKRKLQTPTHKSVYSYAQDIAKEVFQVPSSPPRHAIKHPSPQGVNVRQSSPQRSDRPSSYGQRTNKQMINSHGQHRNHSSPKPNSYHNGPPPAHSKTSLRVNSASPQTGLPRMPPPAHSNPPAKLADLNKSQSPQYTQMRGSPVKPPPAHTIPPRRPWQQERKSQSSPYLTSMEAQIKDIQPLPPLNHDVKLECNSQTWNRAGSEVLSKGSTPTPIGEKVHLQQQKQRQMSAAEYIGGTINRQIQDVSSPHQTTINHLEENMRRQFQGYSESWPSKGTTNARFSKPIPPNVPPLPPLYHTTTSNIHPTSLKRPYVDNWGALYQAQQVQKEIVIQNELHNAMAAKRARMVVDQVQSYTSSQMNVVPDCRQHKPHQEEYNQTPQYAIQKPGRPTQPSHQKYKRSCV